MLMGANMKPKAISIILGRKGSKGVPERTPCS